MIELRVAGIAIDVVSRNPIILLKDLTGHRAIPIYIGQDQAKALIAVIENRQSPRPFTHDLITSILSNLNGVVTDIVINKLLADTFYSTITIKHNGAQFQIDARPSDAIAIALKTKAAIWITEEVFVAAAIPVDKAAEEQARLAEKSFVANLTPGSLIKNAKR
jgi:bifunctional DNase/RNase